MHVLVRCQKLQQTCKESRRRFRCCNCTETCCALISASCFLSCSWVWGGGKGIMGMKTRNKCACRYLKIQHQSAYEREKPEDGVIWETEARATSDMRAWENQSNENIGIAQHVSQACYVLLLHFCLLPFLLATYVRICVCVFAWERVIRQYVCACVYCTRCTSICVLTREMRDCSLFTLSDCTLFTLSITASALCINHDICRELWLTASEGWNRYLVKCV